MFSDLYSNVTPCEELLPYVRRYIYAETKEPVLMTVKPPPTGYVYLSWLFRGCTTIKIDDTEDLKLQHHKLHYAGQIQGQDITVRHQGHYGHLMAECTATGYYQLTGMLGVHTNGTQGALSETAYPLIERFNVKLSGFKDQVDVISQRKDLFESCLIELASIPHAIPIYLKTGVEMIERSDGNTRIADIVSKLQISEKQFARVFSKIVGITPKYFSRILRMNMALGALYTSEHSHMVDIAHQTGYFDQAHFNRTIMEFFSSSPSECLKGDIAALKEILGKVRQF